MESLYREILTSDTKGIAAMLAVVGTFVAAALSSAGYLYRVKIEQKKSLRKVLYLLLEIRHAVIARLFDPDAATEEYLDEMTKRLIDRGIKPDNNEIPIAYRNLISTHFNSMISSLRTELDERLLTPFEEALLDMATVAPALAFQLRGREKLESVIGHTKQYVSQLSGELKVNIPEPFLKPMLDASSGLKDEVLDDIYKTLNQDVMLLAKACGRRDSRACKKIIEKGPSPKQYLNLSELDATIDSLISTLTAKIRADGPKQPDTTSVS
ncbi:MAG: hypothetical protein F9K30_11075 [Dechloromonas sp.]|nr:MAG: hypothetical protein F9K30_11075 [Dechloromonas sp.]